MQPTTLGPNLTGAALAPAALRAMQEAADELTPQREIDTTGIEAHKLMFIEEAEAVGSVPPPATLGGVVAAGVAKLKGSHPTVLLDKLGERLAFERTGTRLYEALLVKYRAAQKEEPKVLPPALDAAGAALAETPEQTLERIRAEELQHFNLLREAMLSLGGDPTAQTPCADVAAVASSGLMQVLNDPRTTLAQSLSAMLTAELTDNAGWELLISLADDAGQDELSGRFLAALGEEQEHLVAIKGWLNALVTDAPRPAFV